MHLTIESLGLRAAGIGHLNAIADADGIVRTEPFVLRHYDHYFHSLAQLMFRIANEAPPDIRAVNPRVPERLAAVIDRSQNKDMAQRYRAGGAIARDLRACLSQAAIPRPDVDIQL